MEVHMLSKERQLGTPLKFGVHGSMLDVLNNSFDHHADDNAVCANSERARILRLCHGD